MWTELDFMCGLEQREFGPEQKCSLSIALSKLGPELIFLCMVQSEFGKVRKGLALTIVQKNLSICPFHGELVSA